MEDADRFRLLFGPHKTPRFHIASRVRCEVGGEVRIVGLSDAPIPWPLCRVGKCRVASVSVGGGRAAGARKVAGNPERLHGRGFGCTAGDSVAREA